MNKLFFLLLFASPVFLYGQSPLQDCAANEMLARTPDAVKLRTTWEENALPFFRALEPDKNAPSANRAAALAIPVVVHIVHNQGSENIPDAQVLEALKDLNDAFAKKGRFASGEGVFVDIQFCLAAQAPNGNPTTGINRVLSPLSNMTLGDDKAVKNLSRWNPRSYLNIWVVSSINQNAFTGYSSAPYLHGNDDDGIVVIAAAMGNGSSVLMHEAGHYLGLFHTFEGGCDNNDCLKSGDLVCDTPPDNSIAPLGHCNATINSCPTDALSGFTQDANDYIWNFMDLGNNDCRTGFTKGQANRMRYFLETARGSLAQSKGCLSACATPITAAFVPSMLTTEVGRTVNFTNTSNNAFQFQWLQDGVFFSNGVNASRTFDQAGQYRILLIASNGRPECEERYSVEIEVVCPIKAKFDVSDPTPLPGDKVTFSNASGVGRYRWFVNNNPIGTATNASYTFPATGRYAVTLVAETLEGTCRDTSTRFIDAVCVEAAFAVGNPYPKPGELVAFANNSQGANAYLWSVDGAPVGTGELLNHVFDKEGVYTVCLEAKNANCANKFCASVYVFKAADETCNGTFLKQFKNGFLSDVQTMLPAPDGGFFLAEHRDQKAFVALVSAQGEPQWTRTFDPSPARDAISKIMLDGNQTLILAGNGHKITDSYIAEGFFLIKYDFVRDTVLWTQAYSQGSKIATADILAKAHDGHYRVWGHTHNTTTPHPNDYWHFVVDLNPHTGQIERTRRYGYSYGVIRGAAPHKGDIYIAGNHTQNLGRLRATLSKYDSVGNLLWAKTYFNPATEESSTTFAKVFVENDSLLAFGWGSLTSLGGANEVLLVAKTDLEGNLVWAKEYNIFEAPRLRFGTVIPLQDGYLIRGNTTLGTDFSDFFIRLDKQGNLVWAKQFYQSFSEEGEFAFLKDGFVYFTNTHHSFGKMTLNGEVAGPACKAITPLTVAVSDLPDRYYYQERFTLLGVSSLLLPAKAILPQKSTTTMSDRYADGCICDLPADSCLLAPDAAIVAATASCRGDSVLVNLTIYNNSAGQLPQGTPIAFYRSDPTTGSAERWGSRPLPKALKQGNAQLFSFALPAPAGLSAFAVVNDNGTVPAPWALDTFPNGHVSECFFQNNLRRFQVSYTPPLLDLGPDIAVCDFSVATFRAAPGFADYTWQDGSKNRAFTAWQAGTYWVKAVDSCGGVHRDTVRVVSNGAKADIGADIAKICAGERAMFGVLGFQRYRWEPSAGLNCDTCAVVVASPLASTKYRLTAITATGCVSTDSVWVEVLPKVTTLETRGLCPGAQTTVFGQTIAQPGIYIARLKGQNGCDSTHTIRVLGLSPSFSNEEKKLCPGDSVWVFNKWVRQPGIFEAHFTGANGCDSTHTITVNAAPAIALDIQKQAAQPGQASGSIRVLASGGTPPFHYQWSIPNAGDTAFVAALAAGVYFVTTTDANGCTAAARIPLGTTALGDADHRLALRLSPNPCAEVLHVGISLEVPTAVIVEIVDIAGRVLLRTEREVVTAQNWSLDLSNLPAAVYGCRLILEGRSYVKIFAKH